MEHTLIYTTLPLELWDVAMCFIDEQIVPDDYCFSPLNKSDCGMPMTPVFTYYLPGSRCEVEFWRGCPTINKFPNEYVCSHYCIGSFLNKPVNASSEPELKDACDMEFNGDDCGQDPTESYTYNKMAGACQQVTYRGCPTENLFTDEDECNRVCRPKAVQMKLMENLTNQELEVIDELLTEVDESNETETETKSEEGDNSEEDATEKNDSQSEEPIDYFESTRLGNSEINNSHEVNKND